MLTDFFTEYGDVKTPNGTPAKLAVYFPQVDDLKKARTQVELILTELGVSAGLVTECHSKAPQADQDALPASTCRNRRTGWCCW